MSHSKKTNHLTGYGVYCYLEDLNRGVGDLRVQNLIQKEMDFFVYLLFWRNNRIFNFINYWKFSRKDERNLSLYAQEYTENIVPLYTLKNLIKVYPEELLKEMISENKDLTFSAIGFKYSYIVQIINYYVNNYHALKNKFKNSQKLSSNEKEKALLKLIDTLYKESL